MGSWFTIFLTLPLLITPPPLIKDVTVSLFDPLDVRLFQLPNDPLATNYIQSLSTSQLGGQTFSLTIEDVTYTRTFNVTNQFAVVSPLVGTDVFISKWTLHPEHALIELFNPTISLKSLDDYSLSVDDQPFAFTLGLTVSPLSRLLIQLQEEEAPLSPPFHSSILIPNLSTMSTLSLKKQTAILDHLPLDTELETLYGAASPFSVIMLRDEKVTSPEPVYQPSSWRYTDAILLSSLTPHQLAQPRMTPRQQAVAWAEYVMYGAGMFAAGRVQEAFEALEQEFYFMHPSSQQDFLNNPNTPINGINEQGNPSSSTFKEALGRYNYIAARVPGAVGLSSNQTVTFNIQEYIIPVASIVLLGGLFIFLKTRKVY
jgi:hypothetical protein